MGPRSNDRGNGSRDHDAWRCEVASMGPRSNDRGNLPGPLPSGGYSCVASMGPRSNDRGNGVYRLNPKPEKPLQWGRDQMIAEIVPAGNSRSAMAMLQWGRDQMIAEMESTA